MKGVIALILASVMLVCFGVAFADGDYQSVYYEDAERYYGIVICTNISIRQSPSTSAKRYGQLHNGDVVAIVGEQNGWYEIDLASTGLSNVPNGSGYAKQGLIRPTPTWIVLTKYTNVYTDPWHTGYKNGEITEGTPMLVITENKEFYDVRLHSGQAGVTFVRKKDVGQFTQDCEPGYAVVVDGPAKVYSYENWKKIDSLETLELVQVFDWEEDFSYVMYERDGQIIYGWVETFFIQPVIN